MPRAGGAIPGKGWSLRAGSYLDKLPQRQGIVGIWHREAIEFRGNAAAGSHAGSRTTVRNLLHIQVIDFLQNQEHVPDPSRAAP